VSDAPNVSEPPPYRNSEAAPFVYFDGVAAFGVMAGAIQIELAGRTIVPDGPKGTSAEFVTTGRLRCSPVAAAALRQAIDNCLKMLEQPPEAATVSAAKLN